MTQMTISRARGQLTKLAGRLKKSHDTVKVTSHGQPTLAILPWDLYEGLEETIEILEDEELMKKIRQGIREIKQGKGVALAKIRKELGL